MANAIRPNGLTPVMHVNGSPWNGQVRKYIIPAANGTATFVGDLVKILTGGDTSGYVACAQAAATNASLGVVVGFDVLPGSVGLDLSQHRRASTLRTAYVCDDPTVVFEIGEGAGTAAGVAALGKNADVIVGAGSTTTGASGMELDPTTVGTTATLVLKIVGAVQRSDNDPTLTRARWLVTINNHQMGPGTGSAGV